MSDQSNSPAPRPVSAFTFPATEFHSNLEPTYSNSAIITHSPSEVVIDFAQILPGRPKPKVYARVIMTPLNAKLFLHALIDNLRKYELQFGEIGIPTNLADNFFKPDTTE